MQLTQMIYNYERTKSVLLKDKIISYLEEHKMTPYYVQLSKKYEWTINEIMIESLSESNKKEIDDINIKLEDAVKNAGDSEVDSSTPEKKKKILIVVSHQVLDFMLQKARTLAAFGDWSASDAALDEILKKEKAGTSKKIDATMEKAKNAIFTMDTEKMKNSIEKAKKLVETGGDWDRRNRLKVYEGMHLMATRDLRKSSKLLMECIATFTCTELCTYPKFIFYTILTGLITLDRNQLRKQLINDPHVISIIRELPHAQALLVGIYDCDYAKFFKSILLIYDEIIEDMYLGPMAVFLIREFRVLAYSQFLESYKSVMLSSMADTFGISSALLDRELSRFIAAGRINAKIDKVGDIIETSRPDKKNSQYQEVIKKGDNLLNQVQKLVRIMDV